MILTTSLFMFLICQKIMERFKSQEARSADSVKLGLPGELTNEVVDSSWKGVKRLRLAEHKKIISNCAIFKFLELFYLHSLTRS